MYFTRNYVSKIAAVNNLNVMLLIVTEASSPHYFQYKREIDGIKQNIYAFYSHFQNISLVVWTV